MQVDERIKTREDEGDNRFYDAQYAKDLSKLIGWNGLRDYALDGYSFGRHEHINCGSNVKSQSRCCESLKNILQIPSTC